MSLVRAAAHAVLLVLAVIVQVVVFRYLAIEGVVPNLVLLVVVVAGLARGPAFGAVVGLVGGLMLDVAPPADTVAGRWALALVLVGHLAGLVRRDARSQPLVALLTVAACSFIGTSVFAISGIVLGDHALPADQMLQVVAVSVLWDLLLTPLVLPPLLSLMRRLRPGVRVAT